uniref:eotaxin-like n=1 Tax=Pristiophorus japonicus TaxID=55135 RepID=UPI00398F719B
MKTALWVSAVLGVLLICSIQDAAPAPGKCWLLIPNILLASDNEQKSGIKTFQCCERLKATHIPHNRLANYRNTIGCSTPAIIFTNKRNMTICTKASEEWVQSAVRYLERRRKN